MHIILLIGIILLVLITIPTFFVSVFLADLFFKPLFKMKVLRLAVTFLVYVVLLIFVLSFFFWKDGGLFWFFSLVTGGYLVTCYVYGDGKFTYGGSKRPSVLRHQARESVKDFNKLVRWGNKRYNGRNKN